MSGTTPANPFVGGPGGAGPPSGESSPASSIGSAQYARRCKRASQHQLQQLTAAASLAGGVPPGATEFGDEFGKLDQALQAILGRFVLLRTGAQELQRDLTVRRCVVDAERLTRLMDACNMVTDDLSQHMTQLDEAQPWFRRLWEEQLDRIRLQQDCYQAHTSKVIQLKDDSSRIGLILQHLQPLLLSITDAIQAMAPRRCAHEGPGPMAQICQQISTLEPNSEQRLDAIEREERNRRNQLETARLNAEDTIIRRRKELKTHRDPMRRKSNLEHGFGPGATGSSVVKEVGRDRPLSSSTHLSPGGSLRSSGRRHAGSESAGNSSAEPGPSPVRSGAGSAMESSTEGPSNALVPEPIALNFQEGGIAPGDAPEGKVENARDPAPSGVSKMLADLSRPDLILDAERQADCSLDNGEYNANYDGAESNTGKIDGHECSSDISDLSEKPKASHDAAVSAERHLVVRQSLEIPVCPSELIANAPVPPTQESDVSLASGTQDVNAPSRTVVPEASNLTDSISNSMEETNCSTPETSENSGFDPGMNSQRSSVDLSQNSLSSNPKSGDPDPPDPASEPEQHVVTQTIILPARPKSAVMVESRGRRIIPVDIKRTVGSGDLDAKERLLASLIQRVKRVDIGPPSKTPERDLGASQP